MRMRELVAPAQALVALLLCMGLGWMLYTMAFFDPTPPTAAEVHMLDTQDADVLAIRTAAAMTVDALLFGPTQILLPVTGPSSTPGPTRTSLPVLSTLVVLPTHTATVTSAVGASATGRPPIAPPGSTATATPLPPTLTLQPTLTSTPVPTATVAPTQTPVPTDEPTATDPPPTSTDVPPTATDVPETPTDPPSTSESPTEPSEPAP